MAAVLAELASSVYSVELLPELAARATAALRSAGYTTVQVRTGDGYQGWPEHAPFDRIILTAAPPELPPALLQQLKKGGRLIAPVGREWQDLVVVDKDADGRLSQRNEYPVIFVPMVPKRD